MVNLSGKSIMLQVHKMNLFQNLMFPFPAKRAYPLILKGNRSKQYWFLDK